MDLEVAGSIPVSHPRHNEKPPPTFGRRGFLAVVIGYWRLLALARDGKKPHPSGQARGVGKNGYLCDMGSEEASPDGPRYVDLFAGAGGLSAGLEAAGYRCVFANELVPRYADTYRANHPGVPVMTGDIRQIDALTVRKEFGLREGELDLMAGGPPCQGFSIYAPVRSSEDPRNHLFREYLRFVAAFRPRAVLIENVPGLVSYEKGATLRAIEEALGALGYGPRVHILGAAYYGVPQMRWRTIILALRGGVMPEEAYPAPRLRAPVRPNFTSTFDGQPLVLEPGPGAPASFTTVEQAIGDLPPLRSGEKGPRVKPYATPPTCPYQAEARRNSPGVCNHEAPALSGINMQRLSHIKPGGNWTDIPPELLPKGMTKARRSDHTMRYGRVSPNGLASTILTRCDPHWGAYFHYSQDRSLTVREAARLQSFPDRYVFGGSAQEQYAQVGNAVPPLLAKAIGEALKKALN